MKNCLIESYSFVIHYHTKEINTIIFLHVVLRGVLLYSNLPPIPVLDGVGVYRQRVKILPIFALGPQNETKTAEKWVNLRFMILFRASLIR